MLRNKEKDSARFLLCSSILDEELFQVYLIIARKTVYPDVKAVSVGLAYDSLKHSKIVRELAKNIVKPELQVKDCAKHLNQLWRDLAVFSERILKPESFEDENLCTLLKDLARVEDAIAEKYAIFTQLRTLQFIASEISSSAPLDLETLKSVFETIVKEKENHRNILIEIAYRLATRKLETEAENSPPIVKYLNPDGWTRPIEA